MSNNTQYSLFSHSVQWTKPIKQWHQWKSHQTAINQHSIFYMTFWLLLPTLIYLPRIKHYDLIVALLFFATILSSIFICSFHDINDILEMLILSLIICITAEKFILLKCAGQNTKTERTINLLEWTLFGQGGSRQISNFIFAVPLFSFIPVLNWILFNNDVRLSLIIFLAWVRNSFQVVPK